MFAGYRGLVIALFALFAVAIGGCANKRGGSIPYDVANFGQPDAPTAVVVDDAYKLAPLDTVAVAVFQVEDLTRDYTIDLSGNITVPLIGQVNALGKSTSELATLLAQRLGQKYLQNPNVTVSLKESARRVVTVEGAVRQPGLYPAVGPLTLIQAVALARGVDDSANPRRVAIFRQVQGQRMAAAFDLVSIRRGEAQDPPVYAGDTVVVDGSGIQTVQRNLLNAVPLLSIFRPF